ncbi:uncharacterized protein LOC144350126 [Saccoglossus kowalevskii]
MWGKALYLLDGFSKGFSLKYVGPRAGGSSPNLKSALNNPDIVWDMLQTEVQTGKVAGLFQAPPFNNLRIFPLGLMPKKQPNKFCLIHHLYCPSDSSINDGIPVELATVQYANIDDAVKIIRDLGLGCFLAKTNIKSAFRIIPVAPHDHCLLGFRWDDHFFFDRCLPMGCSTSCRIFEHFSSALEWIFA